MPLRLTVTYLEGETQMSFASRLAARNGRTSLYPFCRDVGISINALMAGLPRAIDQLANHGGVSPEPLMRYTIGHSDQEKIVGSERLPRAKMPSAARFCPSCAKEAFAGQPADALAYSLPDMIEYWIPWIETCLVHDVALIDLVAPDDATRYAHIPSERAAIVGSNISQIREAIDNSIFQTAQPYEQYLSDRVRGRAPTNEILDQMPLSAIVDTIEALGKAAHTALGGYDKLDNHRECRKAGFELLSGTYAEFKEKILKVWPSENSPFPTNRFGTFGSWLRWRNGSDLFKPAKFVFSKLIGETSSAGPGDIVLGIPIEKRTWHSVWSVANDLKISDKTIWRIAKNRGLITDEKALKPKIEYLLTCEEGEKLISDLRGSIQESDISQTLSVQGVITRSFVDAGILEHVAGTGVPGVDPVISKRNADAFLQNLAECVKVVADSEFTPIHSVLAQARARLADLIAAILDGRLRAERTTSGLTIKEIRLDVASVKQVMSEPDFVRTTKAPRKVSWRKIGYSRL